MRTASLPTPNALELVGTLPGVRFLVWDGLDDPPPGAEQIEFFVGRYGEPPPDAAVLRALPELQVVQLVSAGVEPWLPVVPEGVLLCNGRGVHGASTAELAVAGMLATLRELPRMHAAQAEHRWDPIVTAGLTGRRVLILGAGDIGRRIGTACGAFDAEITFVARTARDDVRTLDELPGLLPEHDVVVVAVPHTEATDRLVDARFLSLMPDGALLVNIARGGIVDTEALLVELTARRLHAFLDVTDPEPLPPEHPMWDAPNLLLTPHVGGGTRRWQERAYRLVRDQVERWRDGHELANKVTDGY